jgi:hypothetical protein
MGQEMIWVSDYVVALNGRVLWAAYVWYRGESVPYYLLEIYCNDTVSPDTRLVWYGVKLTGGSPVGTYHYVDAECGGFGPSTLAVEEV